MRTVIDEGSDETVEKNGYYAFGNRIEDAGNEISDNRHRYNGKEEQAFLKRPFIDYDARMYAPKIAMCWNRPDPLGRKISPYLALCFLCEQSDRLGRSQRYGLVSADGWIADVAR